MWESEKVTWALIKKVIRGKHAINQFPFTTDTWMLSILSPEITGEEWLNSSTVTKYPLVYVDPIVYFFCAVEKLISPWEEAQVKLAKTAELFQNSWNEESTLWNGASLELET